MDQEFTVRPIGKVHSTITEPLDDVWGGTTCRIELDRSRYSPDCLAGLEEFSHVEVVFLFDRVQDADVHTGARHPRGNTAWPKTGIFAQRAKNRPNRIGVSLCPLVSVSAEKLTIVVEGLDAIDGTPVLDLKPYIQEFGVKGSVRQPAWATELMANYWKKRY